MKQPLIAINLKLNPSATSRIQPLRQLHPDLVQPRLLISNGPESLALLFNLFRNRKQHRPQFPVRIGDR